MLHHGVPVALVLHRLQVQRRVALVGGAELVVADGLVVGDFAPFGGADVVLGVDERVADEADVGHDAHEFFRGHGGPDVAVYLGVVDLFFGGYVSWLDLGLFCLCESSFDLCLFLWQLCGEREGGGRGGKRLRTMRVGASIARNLIQSLSS